MEATRYKQEDILVKCIASRYQIYIEMAGVSAFLKSLAGWGGGKGGRDSWNEISMVAAVANPSAFDARANAFGCLSPRWKFAVQPVPSHVSAILQTTV